MFYVVLCPLYSCKSIDIQKNLYIYGFTESVKKGGGQTLDIEL